MALLKADHIHVYYGSIHAVKGVSFEVNEGEVVTLTGSIEFEGKDLKGMPPHKIVEHGLAQCPEGRRIFLQMTVEDNLEMGAFTQPGSTIAGGIADVYKRFPRLEERRRQVAGSSRCWPWAGR